NPYPFWQRGNGYLDGSIQFKLTNYLLVTFDASNILGTKTIVEQQVEDTRPDGTRNLQPYAYQQIDRRFGGGIRLKF
ncbi:MAG: hypothetical protein JO290_05990, partial [Sphingomonadaceae bacterium]|nr:hypothetical protein [Sphingomonadaceae bacterium]